MGAASAISNVILKPLDVDLGMVEYIQLMIDDVEMPLLKSKLVFYRNKKLYLLIGALAALAYKAVGGNDQKSITSAARGVALVTLSGSTFDDVFDDFVEVGLVDQGADNSATLSVAVAMITHGILEIARACEDLTLDKRERIFRTVEQGVATTIDGFQFQNAKRGQTDMSEDEYVEFLCRKACGAWAEIGAKVGAMLGEADDKTVRALGNFAVNFAAALQVFDHMQEIRSDFKYGFYYPPVMLALRPSPIVTEALKNPPIDDSVMDSIFDDEVERHISSNFKRIINELLDAADENLKAIRDSEAKDAMLELVRTLRQ